MASNFVTFFDKFIQLMARLTDSLSEYQAVLKLCTTEAILPGRKGSPEFSRILKRIEAVYGDVLSVFHAAVKVFTRGNARIKRTPMIIADLSTLASF